MFTIDQLIPEQLINEGVESRRRARLIIYAIGLACLTSILASAMLWAIDHHETAPRVLLTLIPHLSIYGVLVVSRSTVITGHSFVWLLLFEIIFRYGEDSGYSVLVATILPMAAANLINAKAGLIWTGIGVLWAAVLGPLYFRPNEFSLGLSLSAAIMTIIVGIGSTIIELTRAKAVKEAKQSARRVLENQARLRNFAESAFQGIAGVNLEGDFVEVEGFEKLIGYRPNELDGKNLFDYIHPDNILLLQSHLQSTPAWGFRMETQIRHANGRWTWLEIYGVPQDEQFHSNSNWLIAARDIQDEQLGRDQLAQAQRLEGMGVLAAGIAHDFNNLLMVISGFAELLPPSPQRDSILVGTDEAATLTAHLMVFGKSSPVTNETLEIGETLAQLEPMFRRVLEPDIQLSIEYPTNKAHLNMPGAQLNQILLNLVTNAKEATPQNGEVEVKVSTVTVGETETGNLGIQTGDFIKVAVSDTGSGFSETSLKRAFDPFYSTKAKLQGSGLGLTSAYGIVRQAGGAIKIEPRAVRGARVSVYLPLATTVVSETMHDPVSDDDNAHPSGEILLVDDDPKVCNLLETMLSKQGYQITAVTSGAEAIERVKINPPNLLITDIMMPGMRGTDLATKLREMVPDLPIIFISGYSDTDVGDWRESTNQNVQFLAKPFREKELLSRVNELIIRPAIAGMP